MVEPTTKRVGSIGRSKINNLVQNLIAEHEGGEKFFDALDESIRIDKSYFEALFDIFIGLSQLRPEVGIVVSGKFGEMFSDWCVANSKELDNQIITLPGGFRNTPLDLRPMFEQSVYSSEHIYGKEFIFIDDSFFLGNTASVASAIISAGGGYISKVVVVYDGSKKKYPNVVSLYRYYE